MAPRTTLVRQVTRKLLAQYKLTPPIPIYAFATETLGYHVIEEPLHDSLSAIADHTDKNILLNANHAPRRRRFTLAHEFGHLFLKHSEAMAQPLDNPFKEARQDFEREADLFAGEFLMPAGAFRSAFETGAKPIELAERFDVSVEAVWVRIKDLRLV